MIQNSQKTSQSGHARLTELLVAARRDRQQIPNLPDELVPETINAAYSVNESVADHLGWEPLGWKIACTTESVRAKLKVRHPIYGRTFKRFACLSPARFLHAELLDPLVECEFFVTLGKDLPARDEPWTMADVIAAIDTVHAGIEVAECRYPTRAMPRLPAVLADGSASGRYVFGTVIERWRDGLAGIAVTLEIDGVARRFGSGKDVMGDPLKPLLWLLEQRRLDGKGMNAGETISTGSMTGMLPIRAGQRVRALFGDDAEVRIAFDG
jgi:2-keto-4-pentenoate hydratase